MKSIEPAVVPPEPAPQLNRVQCGVCAWTSAAHESLAEAYLEVGAHFVNVHRYAAAAVPPEPDRIYPCDDCGMMRTKAEGGTVFTVCDACWPRRHTPVPPEPAPPTAPKATRGHYHDFDPDGVCSAPGCHARPGDPDTRAAAPPTVAPARPKLTAREFARWWLDHECRYGTEREREDMLTKIVNERDRSWQFPSERDRASRSPPPLSGLDAATVEAAGEVEKACELIDGWIFAEPGEEMAARSALWDWRLKYRDATPWGAVISAALATPPGQAKGEQR